MRPAVTERAIRSLSGAAKSFESAEMPERLTAREREVLRLFSAGLSNREIGDALGVVEGTVKNHVHSILQKLGVRDRKPGDAEGNRAGILLTRLARRPRRR